MEVKTEVRPGKRFSKDYQPANKKAKHSVGYYLNRLLKLKVDYTDPSTKELRRGPISKVIAIKLLMNACSGNNEAIKEILDRVDGKNVQKIEGEGLGLDTKLVIIRANSSTNEPIHVDGLKVDGALNSTLDVNPKDVSPEKVLINQKGQGVPMVNIASKVIDEP